MSGNQPIDNPYESLKTINQFLLNGQEGEELVQWFRYFHSTFTSNNSAFLGMFMPKLRTTSDLIYANNYLKDQLSKKNFDALGKMFHMVSTQSINYKGKIISPCINITVKRKSPPTFCFGKKCFEKASRFPISNLFSVKCCKYHNYCKTCIQDHIKSCLVKDPYKGIKCEACLEIGTVKNDEKISIITEKEIDALISQSERVKYYQEESRKKFLTKCENLPYKCPNKGQFILKKDLLELKCGDKICKWCYVNSIVEFVNEVVYCITNNPERFLDYNIVGLMCPTRHLNSGEKLTCEQLAEKMNPELIDDETRRQTLEKYKEYFGYFMGYPIEFCKSCKFIGIKNESHNTVCRKCHRCLYCLAIEHPRIDCNTFKDLGNRFGEIHIKLQRSTDPNDPDRFLITKMMDIFKNAGLSHYKIQFYKKIDPPGLLKYFNGELLKNYHGINSSYLFSQPFPNEDDADNIFYTGLEKLNDRNFYELNLVLKNTPAEFWVMIYRVSYIGDAIQRNPNEQDASDRPLIFRSGDKCYLTTKNSALPYLIVKLSLIA